MTVDARIRLIWRVRGQLGHAGHLILANNPGNPAQHTGLRAELIAALNAAAVAVRHLQADDRGLLTHGRWQRTHEPPEDVVTWQQVWDLVSPGITPERVAELNAAWAERDVQVAYYGQDMRLHLAQCAFYDSPPATPAPEQLDLLDLMGVPA